MRRPRWHTLGLLLAGLLSVIPGIQATATNRTIDDQDGDSVTRAVPQYLPSTGWNKGQQCGGCFVQLDVNQIFHGTWMDGTVPRDGTDPWTITLNFVGTAIYVFNAVANSVTNARTDQNMTFTLDGQNVGEFVHPATSSTEIDYRVQVFARNGLTNGSHTLVIQPQPNSNILFDFAMYTFEDADPSSSTTDGSGAPTSTSDTSSPTSLTNSTSGSGSSSSVKTIVGAVVGTIVGLAIVAALIFFLRRRRRRRGQTPSRGRATLDVDDEKVFAPPRDGPPAHVPSLPPTGSRTMGSSASEADSSAYTGMHRGAESTTLVGGWGSQTGSSVAGLSLAGSSALPSPPPVTGKRANVAASAAAAPSSNSTLHAELVALRQEVARLREDHRASGANQDGATATGSSMSTTPSAPLPTPTWPSARAEKSTYSPTVLSPTSAQESELAGLREELVRLRGEQGNVQSPVDEAPPLYSG